MALGVPVLAGEWAARDRASSRSATYARGNRTLAFLGASGVGKSTLVNALLDDEVMDTAAVREGDQRGRHTTVAAQLLRLPGEGWLIDTPGVRAVSLWLSGDGIERAFADVFALMDHCRFRDCKHDREPGCAVQQAVADGTPRPGAPGQPRAARRRGGGARGRTGTFRPPWRSPRRTASHAELGSVRASLGWGVPIATLTKFVAVAEMARAREEWQMTALESTVDMYDLRMSDKAPPAVRRGQEVHRRGGRAEHGRVLPTRRGPGRALGVRRRPARAAREA